MSKNESIDGSGSGSVNEPRGDSQNNVGKSAGSGLGGGSHTGDRAGSKRGIIIGIVVLAVLLICAGVAIWFFRTQNSAYAQAQSDFQQALSLVQDTDATVISIDDAVNGKVSFDQVDDLQALVDKVSDEQDKLSQAVTILDGVASEYEKHGNGDIVSQLEVSASSRQDMLDKGSSILTYDIAAVKSANDFSQAWTLIINADANSRNAIAAAADGTVETATTARDTNQQALTDLTSAQTLLQTAAGEFPEADFSSVTNYLAAEIQAVQYAHDSEDALVNGDTDTSAAQADSYTTAIANVATLAAAIPADPATIILGAYDTATSTAKVQYEAAREKAMTAEEAVRNYLGIEVAISGSASSSTGIQVGSMATTTSAATSGSTTASAQTASGAQATSSAASVQTVSVLESSPTSSTSAAA